MNRLLKKTLTDFFALCSGIKESENYGAETQSEEKTRLKTECFHFLAYLSSADGRIIEDETDFIFDQLDIQYSPAGLSAYITDHMIYTVDFEQTVPDKLRTLLARDNAVFSESGSLSVSFAITYLDVFECLGHEFLICDSSVTQQEIDDYTTYMAMLRLFVETEAHFPMTAASAVDTSEIRAKQKALDVCENEGEEKEKSLEELLDELNELIGLQMVKRDVHSLIHLQQIKKIRKERGLKEIPISNHIVFYGNPGTGKTTIARLLAQIYHAMGILSKGHLIEVDRAGMVAGYVGQTALKTQDVIQSAMGGVLFIDEAYALTSVGFSGDYGHEAINTLLKAMEDNRDDLVVIAAGYTDLMQQFLDSNPGLRSRFNKILYFDDYTPEELYSIFMLMCSKAGFLLTEGAEALSRQIFETMYASRGKNFANGREVRNFFEKAIVNQADRLYGKTDPTDEELCTITIDDLEPSHIYQEGKGEDPARICETAQREMGK